MTDSRVDSWRRAIVNRLIWALALLVLTNVGWSGWFALRFADAYHAQFVNEMGGYPTGWPELLVSDGRMRIFAWRSDDALPGHAWFTRYNVSTIWAEEAGARSAAAVSSSMTEPAPGWVKPDRSGRGRDLTEDEVQREMYVGVGYPVHLLWCRWMLEDSADVVDPRTAIAVSTRPPPWVGRVENVLPYRPIWRGQLASGALCLAAVVVFSLVWHVVRHGRREFRQWRGRCGRCNYDLRGNTSGVCPECGTGAREVRAVIREESVNG